MITKYGDITARTGGYAVGRFLKRARAKVMIGRFGQTDTQGTNNGVKRIFRRYLPFAAATAPLAEGITPEGQKLDYEDLTADLEEYGDLYPLTNVIQEVHEDNKGSRLLNDMMDNAGKTAAESLELIRFAVLKAGTNRFFANGVAARVNVAGPAVVNDFRKIERYFLAHSAEYVEEIISGSPNVGTVPIEAAFIGFAHTDCKADLEQLTGWTKVADYANNRKALPGEIGSIGAVRILCSPLFKPWAGAGATSSTMLATGGNADVYPLVVLAKDAFSVVPLQGKDAVDISVQQPNKKTKSDPLGQRGSVAWTAWDACVILQESFVACLEVAATDL